jgi:GcrA cell cycle regulator
MTLVLRAPEGERTLLDLRNNECKWPTTEPTLDVLGHFLFCGAPTVPGESYCRRHQAIAKPPTRRG